MGSWKRYLAALVLNAAVALLVLFVRGFEYKIYYVDAFSTAGGVSVLLGLLFWITAAGAFDTFGYGFSVIFSNGKYKDLYEYSTRKRERRGGGYKSFLPYLVVGAVFVAASVLISIV